jgi:hypothetical protein
VNFCVILLLDMTSGICSAENLFEYGSYGRRQLATAAIDGTAMDRSDRAQPGSFGLRGELVS